MIDWESVDLRSEFPTIIGEIIEECGTNRFCIARETAGMLKRLGEQLQGDAAYLTKLKQLEEIVEIILEFIRFMRKIVGEK